MKTGKHSDGFVLTGVLALLVIASLIGGAFLFSARNSLRTVDRWEGYDECLWAIQSGLEARKYQLYEDFRQEYDLEHSWDSLDVLANYDEEVVVLVTGDDVTILDGGLSGLMSTGDSGMAVTVAVHTVSAGVQRDYVNYEATITITNIATATYKGVTRKIQEEVLYEYAKAGTPPGGGSGGPRGVFDYIFFIDNDAYFSGVNANFNGDVRANENIELKYSSILLNGDAYAVGIIDTKKDYKNQNWSKYSTQPYADTARPADYTDFNRSNTNTYWQRGYTEASAYNEGVERLELPFIGPLEEYEAYAVTTGGTVSQGGALKVDAIWGDDAGEDIPGVAGTLDDGSLFLDGTVTPIEIDGIIVARGDVYIKGNYTGQGTIYAGRNVHIIGDVVAVDPPSWPKPDSNPRATANVNKNKDFLGLCAKGSLVFGDYNSWATHVDQKYLKNPYTKSHAVDATDALNGYVKFYQDGVPYFDGDYTQQDGEFFDAVQTDGDPRLYYESTLSAADFAALGVSAWVGEFDCVTYANHLFMGEIDNNAVFNGSIVCRDEAIKRHGNLALNWDIRLGSDSNDGAGFAPWLPGMLPRIALATQMVRWMELPVE